MIKTEEAGIGLFGKEGTQAAQIGDNAVRKFRRLQKLLLCHWMKAYCGVAFIIKMSIFKNVCFAMLQFWHSIMCGWSGQTFNEDWMASAYNFTITFMPPVVGGIEDVVLSFYETKLYLEVFWRVRQAPTLCLSRSPSSGLSLPSARAPSSSASTSSSLQSTSSQRTERSTAMATQ